MASYAYLIDYSLILFVFRQNRTFCIPFKITISPNPANNLITVTCKDQTIDNILIFNTLGELVLRQKQPIVRINHLPKGVYLVKATVGNKIALEKLVVQ